MDYPILTHEELKTHDDFHANQKDLCVLLCELIGDAREGFGMIEDLIELVEELLNSVKGKLMVL